MPAKTPRLALSVRSAPSFPHERCAGPLLLLAPQVLLLTYSFVPPRSSPMPDDLLRKEPLCPAPSHCRSCTTGERHLRRSIATCLCGASSSNLSPVAYSEG